MTLVLATAIPLFSSSLLAHPSSDTATEQTAKQIPQQAVKQANAYASSEFTRISFTNARTGETFSLEDFAGKTVVVEPMAIWCGACRGQLRRDAQAMAQLNSEDYVLVALSVDDRTSNQALAAYADRHDFDFVFAIAPLEMLLKLRTMFGRGALNPPATPHFFISPTGQISGLSVGAMKPEDLVTRLQIIHAGSN
jgi:peroxiredoxin